MAVSDALLPSFSTFASGPAGREKTLRPAGAPNNVSVVALGGGERSVGFCGLDGDGRSPGVTENHRVKGRSDSRASSAAFLGWPPAPMSQLYVRVTGRCRAAGGAHPVRTRLLERRLQSRRAGHRAGGVCVPRHWLGPRELGA